MPKTLKPIPLKSIQAVVFDFDGVFTDNRVYVDQNGVESVACNRSDGLAFDVLRKTPLKLFILSKEKNGVVTARAKKLKLEVFQDVDKKDSALKKLAAKKGFELSRTVYVGNDLNDYHAMSLCTYRVCPADSHPKIRALATHLLPVKGGEGVIRYLTETVFRMDVLKAIS